MKKSSKTGHCLVFRGQGVFAAQDIKKGDVLEYSPVIPLSAGEWASVSQTVLRYSCYPWGKDEKDAAVALGYGSLFNGSFEPTAYCISLLDDLVMEFCAARDIKKGEEITVNRRKPGIKGFARDTEARRFEMIAVRNSPNKGRGVFALRDIAGGELIEKAPALFVPAQEWSYIRNTILDNYCFRIGPNQEHAALAMGYGSLYNHSYTPNAVYDVKDEEMAVQFNALRDIRAGEEITVNYNRDPRDRSPVWFEVLP